MPLAAFYGWFSCCPTGSSRGFGSNFRKSIRRTFGGRPQNLYSRRAQLPDHLILEETRARDHDDDKPTTSKVDGLMKTIHVDLHVAENRTAHHTSEYELENLIIRRGQSFSLTTTFDRDFDKTKDKVILQFVTSNRPKPSKGTLVRVPIVNKLDKGKWGAKILESVGKTIKYEVMTPSHCIVAPWTLFIVTQYEDKDEDAYMFRHEVEDDIHVLFNPWNNDDNVYMGDTAEREEYVLNETGRIWIGSQKRFMGKPWNFGQFEDVCLLAAMRLLDLADLSDQARGNPVLVVRAISALANSNDNDGGVLTGNWSGDYGGGTPPVAWNGSVAILEEYMRTKNEVKYGQCWVFSGLVTTLLRTLGIPTRSVTNFESAHDNDGSMSIDFHWDKNSGEPRNRLNDSIWNFHVWNESWMARTDLPKGYDGWQAHDATPQEVSEGVMRCGPAPLTAVKNGEVYIGYDSKFIFAEVNGDKVEWLVDANGNLEMINVNNSCIGKYISTKEVGGNGRQDLTPLYKHPDGCEEEKVALAKAYNYSSRQQDLTVKDTSRDVAFDFDDSIELNGNMKFILKMRNKTGEKRTVDITIVAAAAYYTGIPGETLTKEKNTTILEPNSTSEFELPLMAVNYLDKLDCDATVKIYCNAKVEETGQRFTTTESLEIEKPDLDVQVSTDKPKVGYAFEVTVKFTNPLSVPLTQGVISIEGPGIARTLSVSVRKSINPGKVLIEKIHLTPKFQGKREIICSFNSRQLTNITGSAVVEIQKV
ncbi:coagulation factor XIII A chain-like [Tubulanus polymorphus]|uniref:coagulation factor XIII A chain-like n=1 Tax=Tubulanus polymorphus TaxID=672921 RepID=UPI003DA378A7